MPQINLTAKEINIIVQAIRLAMDSEYNGISDQLKEYAKKAEINQLRNKLQNVKDV